MPVSNPSKPDAHSLGSGHHVETRASPHGGGVGESAPAPSGDGERESSGRTLAQANRERRDIVSGTVMEEDQLIRFVAGPEGLVVADLARKLPGRGMWVAANREAVETAQRKNLFARSAKAKLNAPADLADQVEILLRRRILDALGLAKRAGDLILGFEKVKDTVVTGKAAWLIEASDGSDDGRRKLLQAVHRAPSKPRLFGVFTSDEMGLALGGDNVIHLALLAGRGAKRWSAEADRLAGFRPLLPESWREEP